MNGLKVIVKRPGIAPRFESVSDDDDIQKIVGGWFEIVPIESGVAVICNEEGKIRNYPYNCTIAGMDFVGTVLIVGIDGEDFADVPIKISELKELMG